MVASKLPVKEATDAEETVKVETVKVATVRVATEEATVKVVHAEIAVEHTGDVEEIRKGRSSLVNNRHPPRKRNLSKKTTECTVTFRDV
jgi:hypothetical protein